MSPVTLHKWHKGDEAMFILCSQARVRAESVLTLWNQLVHGSFDSAGMAAWLILLFHSRMEKVEGGNAGYAMKWCSYAFVKYLPFCVECLASFSFVTILFVKPCQCCIGI